MQTIQEKHRLWVRLFIVLAVLIGLALLWRLLSVLHYTCPIERLFGFPCAGCGMTRAAYRVLNGDFSAAFAENSLVFILPVYLVVFVAAFVCGRMEWVKNRWFLGSLCGIIFIVWGIRLLMFFEIV